MLMSPGSRLPHQSFTNFIKLRWVTMTTFKNGSIVHVDWILDWYSSKNTCLLFTINSLSSFIIIMKHDNSYPLYFTLIYETVSVGSNFDWYFQVTYNTLRSVQYILISYLKEIYLSFTKCCKIFFYCSNVTNIFSYCI